MFVIIGADVEKDRQRRRRLQPRARRGERQLGDRNSHAAGALIAETENARADRRIAKVSKMATVTAVICVPNSWAMSLGTNTVRKKSKTSKVHPKKLAATACL